MREQPPRTTRANNWGKWLTASTHSSEKDLPRYSKLELEAGPHRAREHRHPDSAMVLRPGPRP